MDNNLLKNITHKKLRGFHNKLPRQEFLLQRVLKDSEFCLYTVIKYIFTDWDHRHDLYGFFKYNPKHICTINQWSESKVRRNFKELLRKNLIQLIDKNEKLYSLVGFEIADAVFLRRDEDIKPFEYIRILLGATLLQQKSKTHKEHVKINEFFADLNITPLEKVKLPITNRSKYRFSLVSFKGNLVYREIEEDNLTTEVRADDIDLDEIIKIID